jgi:hypothetical protein
VSFKTFALDQFAQYLRPNLRSLVLSSFRVYYPQEQNDILIEFKINTLCDLIHNIEMLGLQKSGSFIPNKAYFEGNVTKRKDNYKTK